ncbi:uncharacterized protein FIBRA_06368 [Fibroporia radiculosa]|uniref:Uncharacterized protein n=1 Tax=Fibroporia radiculosa TaxID=599839 RepID=J4HZ00_9APHY|nr:uncharacterized protein FIBRA_06368 [Fibroporia radiculosa]CCM04202.1 predicted protein [Fibroporia radiculosa]
MGRDKAHKPEGGRSFLSRKSVRKAAEPAIDAPPSENPSLTPTESRTSSAKDRDAPGDEHSQLRNFFTLPATSLIPDPLAELPPWFHTDTDGWAAANSPGSLRSRYPMHNSAGPRWYRNYHLLPPQENSPPSQFSPSFPPMPSAAERSQESTRVPTMSRTPSGSPSPTPNSSQLKITDPGGRVRTRKISQTDNVDMLDVTDPTGTNWHHESPYDVGLRNDAENPTEPRARRMSLNAGGGRHKTVTPSPLSQSTSALHLHTTEPASSNLSRRFSKRRKPFVGLFGSQSQDNVHLHPKSPSAPSEPVRAHRLDDSTQRKMFRRRSTVDPPVAFASVTSLHPGSAQKDKHSSFMGRLAKRFSVLRKPDLAKHSSNILVSPTSGGDFSEDLGPSSASVKSPNSAARSLMNGAKSPDSSKRIPPPSVDDESLAHTVNDTTAGLERASTATSVEDSSALGKLTITNPDGPGSADRSPAEVQSPLPNVNAVTEPVKLESQLLSAEDAQPTPELSASMSPVMSGAPVLPPVDTSVEGQTSLFDSNVSLSSPRRPFNHSLPPTPATERPLSLFTEQPTILSSPQTHNLDMGSYAASASGLTAYAPSAVSGTADDPTLARASILVNPPTPHVAPMVMFPTKATTTPVVSHESHKHREGSPSKAKEGAHVKSPSTTRRRETETFKLVRSSSGNAPSNGDVIVGMGEQWEVVESPSELFPKKSKKTVRSNSKEDGNPTAVPDSRRQEPSGGSEERDHRQHRRQRSANERAAVEQTSSTSRSTRTPSVDTVRRAYGHDGQSRTSQRREHEPEASHSSKTTPYRRHDRQTSASGRPTSYLQSSADMNTLKAKEAWEMERLWKARSMTYGPDGVAVFPTPPTIRDGSRPSTFMSGDVRAAGTIPSVTDLHRATTLPAPAHGSSHTYFMVQAPVQGHAPVPPPPIIYSSVPYAQQSNNSAAPRQRQVSRSLSDRVPFPVPDTHVDPPSASRTYLANPLPDPPRLTTFQGSSLPHSLATAGSGSSQYRPQYAAVPSRY